MSYKGASPDEKALVSNVAEMGIVLEKIDAQNNVEVRVLNEMRQFQRLHVLDFTSERRCMSVIVKDMQSGRVK